MRRILITTPARLAATIAMASVQPMSTLLLVDDPIQHHPPEERIRPSMPSMPFIEYTNSGTLGCMNAPEYQRLPRRHSRKGYR